MYKTYKKKNGLIKIPLIVGLVIMAIALMLVTKLVQQNTENRSKATEQPKATIITSEYGKSGLNRSLKVVSIEPKEIKSKVLVTFEIHGYEDAYSKDGQVLVNTANKLIEYFSNHPKELGNTALYVVPSANPDGLIDGTTNNGKGRGQISKGVDINRDFDYHWIKRTNSRNKTLSPFSVPESRALRDLVIKIKPTDVIDIHGWLSTTYGTSSLCQYFEDSLGISRSSSLSGASGYFSAWAMNHAERTALIELPSPKTDPQKIINAFVKLLDVK